MTTSVTIYSSAVKLSIESELVEEPQIHLLSTIDFSSLTAICMQLSQPQKQLVQVIKKSILVPGERKQNSLKRQTNLRYNLPGYTHVLNRKNNDMCNRILK